MSDLIGQDKQYDYKSNQPNSKYIHVKLHGEHFEGHHVLLSLSFAKNGLIAQLVS